MWTGLLVLLVAVIALLAMPVTLSFRLAWPDVADNDVRLGWAFGLVRVNFPTTPAGPDRPSGQQPMDRQAPSSRRKVNVWAAIRQSGFRRRVGRFMGDLWRAVHKRDVRLRVRIGLGDPADTGQLWGAIGPVSGVLGNFRDIAIFIEPEFQEETLALAGSGRIRIVPLQLLYLAVGLGLSPAIWRGLRAMRV